MPARGLPTDGPANATQFSEWKNVCVCEMPSRGFPNGNKRPMSTWDQRFLYQICTFRCDTKRARTRNVLYLSRPGYWWFLSLRAIYTHLSIDASPCRFACDWLLALIRKRLLLLHACVVQQVNTYERVPNWFRLSGNRLCEWRSSQLSDKIICWEFLHWLGQREVYFWI